MKRNDEEMSEGKKMNEGTRDRMKEGWEGWEGKKEGRIKCMEE